MWPARHHLLQRENHQGHQRHHRRRHGDHLHHASAPAGFYATALSYSTNCEISKTPNGVLNNQQTLTNINGLPAGRTLIICGVQSAPSGWTVVAVVQTYLCVYARGGGVGDNAVSIRKL